MLKKDITEGSDRVACVLVDEAQFLTREQVQQLGEVVDVIGVPVLWWVNMPRGAEFGLIFFFFF